MEKSSPIKSRAPGSGLKLMLAILVVFAFLAGYGQWKRSQQLTAVTTDVVPAPNEPAIPSSNRRDKTEQLDGTNLSRRPPTTPGRIVAPGVSKARMEPVGTPAPEPIASPQQSPDKK